MYRDKYWCHIYAYGMVELVIYSYLKGDYSRVFVLNAFAYIFLFFFWKNVF